MYINLYKLSLFVLGTILNMKIPLDYIKEQFSSNYRRYVKMFIAEYDNIDEYFNYKFLLNGVQSTLRLLEQKTINENYKISFYDSYNEESKIHILDIVHVDRPFLIDSINNYFKFIKARTINSINFTINVQRTEDNKLTFTHSKQKSEKIIVMQVVLENFNDEQKIANVTDDIKYILETMNDAINDWQKIIDTLNNIKNFIYSINNLLVQDKNECIDFINWLIDKKFIFLGFADCDYHSNKDQMSQILVRKNIEKSLGIARSKLSQNSAISMYDYADKIVELEQNKFPILKIVKSRNFSLIHRSQYMDCVKIKKFNKNGDAIGEFKVFGMFSSIVYHQDARQIPIVNRKIVEIEKRARFSIGSQNNKNLISILQDLPRDNLFQHDAQYLHMISVEVLKIIKHPDVRVFLQVNANAKFINCLLFIPYNIADNDLSERIARLFRKEIQATLLSKFINVNEFELVQMQLAFSAENTDLENFNLKKLTEKIIGISKNWTDLFRLQFNIKDLQDRYLLRKYQYSVSQKYQRDFDHAAGKRDTRQIEILLNTSSLIMARFYCEDSKLKLFIYTKLSSEDFTLSSLIPIVDNMGMKTVRNNIYQFIIGDQKINMHSFDLQYPRQHISKTQMENLEQLLIHVLEQTIENDILNILVLYAELEWRQIILLRALIKYIKQMNIIYSVQYIQETLLKYPKITHALLTFFHTKFSPELTKNRQRQMQLSRKKFEKLVFEIPHIAEENIFKYLINVLDAMMRTNFYQETKDNEFNFRDTNLKCYISFKIKSDLIEIMPLPKPFSEIFVYSKNMEGVHLRGGKVARGGIRWSDRLDDFRNEVLGLMKAQVTKNTVIVPTGAKGGFIIKSSEKNNPQDAVHYYRKYLHGILDLMDNVDANSEIIHPENVVIHDEQDYYIVAAADKGTATFSNYANEVSKEYNFWLQDAFASGGSNGYDHKQMAITSRGAWISVIKHFASLGKDISKEKFTVAGIGDMSGDVFGNGMLLSQNILLFAAFNHKHIFLDPNPDNLKSYQERKRLFELPRSNWTDYNPELISKGGGVFERSAKKIPLSPQICKALNIKNKELAPNDLIKAILKAPLELLWNGGIGTYVKSEHETHSCVFDKANDGLRINGKDLQVDVIGEGGNLGFTQLGRIEFAQRSNKKINTDFIDNSAGVDCSDHEVNIKIALIEAIKKGKITLEQRNELMEEMTDEVAEIVLRDNHMQNFAITMIQIKSNHDVSKDVRVLRKLEEIDLINRKIDFLPDDKQVKLMIKNEQGFSRPEISVLLSYVKMFLYDHEKIYKYNIIDDPFFQKSLFNYFPRRMHKDFADEIHNHKLKREIIATYIVNEMVNYLGINFIFRIIDITNSSYRSLIRVYFMVKNVFQMENFWHIFEKNIFNINGQNARCQLLSYIDKFFLYNFCILLPKFDDEIILQTWIKKYQPSVNILRKNVDAFLPRKVKNVMQKNINAFIKKNVDSKFIQHTVSLDVYKFFPNIINISVEKNYDLLETAKIYFAMFEELLIYRLNDVLYDFYANYWDAIAAKILISQLNDHHIIIVKYVITSMQEKNTNFQEIIEKLMIENKYLLEKYLHFIDKCILSIPREEINLGNLNVALNKISSLIMNLEK